MKDIVLHLAVPDSVADELIEDLANVVDDEHDDGQWTHLSMRLEKWGNGGTLPTQYPVRVDSFGVEE